MVKDKVDTTGWYVRKYCMPIVFAHFVCALLAFCTRKFPAKSENKTSTFIIEQRSYVVFTRILLDIVFTWYVKGGKGK